MTVTITMKKCARPQFQLLELPGKFFDQPSKACKHVIFAWHKRTTNDLPIRLTTNSDP